MLMTYNHFSNNKRPVKLFETNLFCFAKRQCFSWTPLTIDVPFICHPAISHLRVAGAGGRRTLQRWAPAMDPMSMGYLHGGFQSMGVPPVLIHLQMDFPMERFTIQRFWVPPFVEHPINIEHRYIYTLYYTIGVSNIDCTIIGNSLKKNNSIIHTVTYQTQVY